MPSASTGRALGSVLRCFTTISALNGFQAADHGSNFRKKSSVRVFQANNKFLFICFDYLVKLFFNFKIHIDYLPKELSVGVAKFSETAQILG